MLLELQLQPIYKRTYRDSVERNVSDINILSYLLKGEIFYRFCAPPQERPVVVEKTNSMKFRLRRFNL